MPTNKSVRSGLLKSASDHVRNFTISVDEEHIKRAKPNTQAWCMVALAIRDCVEGAHTVRVDTSFIRFSIGNTGEGGVRYAFPTPVRVAKPIQLFDQSEVEDKSSVIKPFKFQLAAVQGYINPMIKRSQPGVAPRGRAQGKSCTKKYRWNGSPVYFEEKESV